MSDILVQIIFGWPAVITSLALSVAGILWRKPVMLIIGGVVCLPFAWYLSGYPSIRSAAILIPLMVGGAAYAVYKKKTALPGFCSRRSSSSVPGWRISLSRNRITPLLRRGG